MCLHFNKIERHEEARMGEALKSTVAGLGLLNMAGVNAAREKSTTMTGKIGVSCCFVSEDLCWRFTSFF